MPLPRVEQVGLPLSVSLPGGSARIVLTLLVPSPVAPLPVNGSVPESTLAVGWSIQAGQGNQNPSNLVFDLSEAITLKVGNARTACKATCSRTPSWASTDAGAETKVKPPKAVTVGVKQEEASASCSADYMKCLQSTVTIVDADGNLVPFDAANPLLIDLFRPIGTLKKGANISNATLSYSANGETSLPIVECERVGTGWKIPDGYLFCQGASSLRRSR